MMIEIDKPHVGLRILAIGDDAAILDAADQRLHLAVIGAHHGKAVERHILDEGLKRILHGIESLEMIEMLGIDIGDDGDIGNFRKVPSDSSASTTIQSPAPSLALVP